jgi:hypothetical protein
MLRSALALFAVLALCFATAAGAEDRRAQEKRATMFQIFSSMRVLLPLSVDPEKLGAKENITGVKSALDNLASNGSALASHTKREDPGASFLGRSLADDALELRRRYQRKDYEGAAFLVHEMTRYCIACHARLPSKSSMLSAQFVEGTELGKLPLDERAHLQLATRRFDEALTTFEEMFATKKTHASQMVAPLSDYLTTAVRVRKDLPRARKTLKKFAARDDLWTQLKSDLKAWDRALKRFEKTPPRPTLKAARGIIDEAQRIADYPADRKPLVHYVMASAVLNRFIESAPKDKKDAAEAYFLLTIAESRIEQNYWLSSAEAYLETCVRLAPKTNVAERCYALLEEQVVLGYSGTLGTHIPEDLERRLHELEVLARGGR